MGKFEFSEVTDIEMKIDYSKGLEVGAFKKGTIKRELFIVYDGPAMSFSKKVRSQFFEDLNEWMDKNDT